MATSGEAHEERDRLLDALSTALVGHGAAAVWLDGSLGRGEGDAHSDLDLGVAVADDLLATFLDGQSKVIRSVCDPVLYRQAGRLTHLVTADWLRVDILVRTSTDAAGGLPGPVQVLADPEGIVMPQTAHPVATPELLVSLIEEFLRFLGLLPVVAARDEWAGAYIATGQMAGMLAQLMQLENGTTRTVGGALALNRRLTPEQQVELTALPSVRPDRLAVVATQTALAASFLPRARQLCAVTNVTYPDRLESALRAHLHRAAITLPN